MPFIVAADGTQLAYESYGQGEPVLFCNGVMLSTSMWDYQVPFLVDRGYRCVLHDWRGHGRSDRPSSGYDMATLAADLDTLIEELDLHNVRLVGHSGGAAVAASAAAAGFPVAVQDLIRAVASAAVRAAYSHRASASPGVSGESGRAGRVHRWASLGQDRSAASLPPPYQTGSPFLAVSPGTRRRTR